MPGLISNMFQPADGGQDESTQTTTITGDGETGVEASPSVDVGMSGSYEDADGNTHQWSNETSIGTDVDVDAAFAATATLTGDAMSGSE